MSESDARHKASPWQSWLCLALGAALLLISNGRWIHPWAPWLALALILRFVRREKAFPGLAIGAAAYTAVLLASFHGVVPLPGMLYYIVMAGIGLSAFLPFVADRLLAPRLHGFSATLVLPAAWVALEYSSSLFSPFGTWGALAYTQYGFLPLMQLASVTGIWGIGFLIVWFAAIVNWAWERGFRLREITAGIMVFAVLFGAVLIGGGARLTHLKPGNKVKVAALIPPRTITERVAQIPGGDISRASILKATAGLADAMLDQSRLAARSGAKIVLWSEGAVALRPEDEERYIGQGCALARQEGNYLFMAVAVMPPNYPRSPCENKLVWISPEGKVLKEYLKSRPVPGEPTIKGPGTIPVHGTGYGRIGSAICYDMDFPGLIRQAGKAGADWCWSRPAIGAKSPSFTRAWRLSARSKTDST